MTPQEQKLLQDLTDRINQTVLPEKDPDAEQFIQQSLSRNPDSLYIMAQTVLVQQYALDQAKQQLDQLKQQPPPQPKHATSFLGNLLGMNDPAPPPPPPPTQYTPVNNSGPQYGNSGSQYGAPTYSQPQYAPPQYAQPGYGQPAYGQPQGGGFLRSAMQTATGVAAGALAFEGIESLMHGFGSHAGYGQNFGGGGGGETINNYYGENSHEHGDLSDRFQSAGDHPSNDIEDRRNDNFASNDDSLADNDPDDFAANNADDSSNFDDNSGSDFSSSDDSN